MGRAGHDDNRTPTLVGLSNANDGVIVEGWFDPVTHRFLISSAITKTALTASSPTAATVGVTSASAVAANAARKGLVLVNTSANNISLGIGVAAVLNSGITLTPNGAWTMDDYSFTLGAINAIAAGATSNLAIQEFTT